MEAGWSLAPGLQWVQIDLGKAADIYGILLWHSTAIRGFIATW
jgi:hypothetical protein